MHTAPATRRPALALLPVLLLGFAACNPDSTTEALHPDGGSTGVDGGGDLPDAGVETPDAGVEEPDAGVEEPDAGVETPDAGVEEPDAGVETPDAGEYVLRFVALGDTGTGSEKQYAVAAAIQQVCDARGGCELGLLLGDNFYDIGVASANDALFNSMFVVPYGPLGFPFYPTLGNHDLGGEYTGGAGLNLSKESYYLEYGRTNPQWVMPAEHHTFDFAPVTFVNLNTPRLFLGEVADNGQYDAVPKWIAESQQPWKLAFGHHPYLSVGKHGNAGNYEGLRDYWDYVSSNLCTSSNFLVQAAKIPAGCHLVDFMNDEICGKVDVYLSGHDHSMQDLGRVCGTEFLVSGAGAKTTEFPNRDENAFHWMGEKTPGGELQIGFTLVEATRSTMTFTFFDENATQLHTRTISK